MDNDTRHPLLAAFLAYYRPHVGLFLADTVCALGVAAIDLAFPQILRRLTGGLFTQSPDVIRGALLYLTIGLLAMYALRYFCRWFVTSWGHVMGARMESAMRQDLFDQYERFSFAYFDHHNTGDLMSRVVSDLFDIAEAAHHGPEWIVICTIEIVGSFVILAWISWRLSLALALVTGALFVFGLWGNARLAEVFRDNRRRISEVNQQLEDSLAGMRVVKSFTGERIESAKFARSNEAYLDSKARMYHAMGAFNASISGFTGVLYTVIVIYGGALIARGDLTAADLATYALYVSMFLSPIQTILDFTEMFQKAKAGFERFFEVLRTTPDVEDRPGAQELHITEGRVVYQGVRFSYGEGAAAEGSAGPQPASDVLGSEEGPVQELPASGELRAEHVLNGLDLVLEPGKTTALVGPSGGGKSTTCSLLPRFYDVEEGSVTIDGTDVRDVTVQSLRRAIGVVQQDVYLFGGTIGENIAYGRPEATFEEVRAAARAANIAEFVEGLPDGYETLVGERGCRLSGGQKQRIAIARVFLKNPQILILDEATSALDNESERAVQESLERLARGRTTLVIAHRLSTIRAADAIATIEAGRVVEYGTHEELLARGGTYARYYHMQFGV